MASELYVRRYNKVRRALKRSYRQLRRLGGWRAVGKAFGISGTMAYRIVEEQYMPTTSEVCRALGLPVKIELEVHPKTGRLVIPKEYRHQRTVKELADMSTAELLYMIQNREEMS